MVDVRRNTQGNSCHEQMFYIKYLTKLSGKFLKYVLEIG